MPPLAVARRVLVTVAGLAVLLVGVILLALPGPGFLVVALGFLILSVEYAWARRLYGSARDRAVLLARASSRSVLGIVFSLGFGLGAVGLGLVWGLVPELPYSSWWVGGSLIVSGLVVIGSVIAAGVIERRERAATSASAPVQLSESPP